MIRQAKKLKAFSIFSFLAGFMTAAFLLGVWFSPGVKNVSAEIAMPDYTCMNSALDIIEWNAWWGPDPTYKLNTCLQGRGYKIKELHQHSGNIIRVVIGK
jgi:hypothetical protein